MSPWIGVPTKGKWAARRLLGNHEMKTRAAWIVLTLAAGYAAACALHESSPQSNPGSAQTDGGPGTSGATPPPPTPSPQCTALATAFCKLEAQCDTVDMQALFAGSASACIARTVFSCPNVSETGTGNTPATIDACATAISQISGCDAFAMYGLVNQGALCPSLPGTLADGASCDDDSQCKGGLCSFGAESTSPEAGPTSCGACAEKPVSPLCQESSECPSGQLCNANGTCVVPGGAGASCDDSNADFAVEPCGALLYCELAISADGGTADGGTAAMGTCAPLGEAGEPCNAYDDVNDCADGLSCSQAGVCAAIQFVAVGGACDGVSLACAGSTCAFTSADGSALGTCTPLANDGAACQSDSDCQFNAFCGDNEVCATRAPGVCD
jgi:hypothetical protein